MPQLDPTTFVSQVFWLVICFAFLVTYSAKVTLPQLNKVFGHRYDKIEGIKAIGLSLQNQIQQLNDERQQQLSKARHYAHDHVVQVTNTLNKQFAQTKLTYLGEMKQQMKTYELQLKIDEPTMINDLKTVSEDIAQYIVNIISPATQPLASQNKAMKGTTNEI